MVALSYFYYFREEFKAHALEVSAKAIKTIEDGVAYMHGETVIPHHPIIFHHRMGGRCYDMIDGNIPMFLLSDRVIAALRQHNISGWKGYPAEVYDKRHNLVPGYTLLGITGRAGPFDDTTGETITKPPRVPNGPCWKARRGRYFDPTSWDGSDFFIPQDKWFVMATERVKAALSPLKTKNITLTPLLEFEIAERYVLRKET